MVECTDEKCHYGWWHWECVETFTDSTLTDIESNHNWLCPFCVKSPTSEPNGGAGAPAAAAEVGGGGAGSVTATDNVSSSVSIVMSTGRSITDHFDLINLTITTSSQLVNVLGLPSRISASSSTITSTALHSLKAAAQRSNRDGENVTQDALTALLAREAAGCAKVIYTTEPLSLLVTSLWAVFWSPETELARKVERVTVVQSIDFTHTSSPSNLHLGASVGFVGNAGAFPIPLIFFVYLAGAGIKDEMTNVSTY